MSRGKIHIAVSLAIGLIAALPHLSAQTQFEVASIRANNSGLPTGSLSGTDSTRFTARNITLNLLMRLAWQVRDYQILDGPAWVASDRFDITAKPETEVDNDQMMLMLRGLLEERFHLEVRSETRDLPVYALTPAKGGLKLHSGACVEVEKLSASPATAIPCGRVRIFTNGLDGQTSMPLFVNLISDLVGRPVIDETGFGGPFDVRLRWTPDDSTPGNRSGDSLPRADSADPSFFTALEEQLGLRLESRKGPLETITIEHAEKPGGN